MVTAIIKWNKHSGSLLYANKKLVAHLAEQVVHILQILSPYAEVQVWFWPLAASPPFLSMQPSCWGQNIGHTTQEVSGHPKVCTTDAVWSPFQDTTVNITASVVDLICKTTTQLNPKLQLNHFTTRIIWNIIKTHSVWLSHSLGLQSGNSLQCKKCSKGNGKGIYCNSQIEETDWHVAEVIFYTYDFMLQIHWLIYQKSWK